jgi:bacteriophage N4 adsorption protein B
VISYLQASAGAIDTCVRWILPALTLAILISGVDDLFVNTVWLAYWLRANLMPSARLFPPGTRQLDAAPRRKIAILVPLWQEHAVIADMLQHNLASIRYPDYHFFAGCYPNDDQTQEAVLSVARRVQNVHMAVTPHNGPTSKADCLNWIYQHLLLYEDEHGERFDLIMTHDAEDMIHPEELRWINFYAGRFDFVQTPVLPMATPLRNWMHGIYCDEFAESHSIDMMVRPLTGGFVPSCGVGTSYRREALELLAKSASNRIFEPESLTEDYENGLRLFRLGVSQCFVPISRSAGPGSDWMVTREFFPDKWGAAVRQRTRWVTGISLQGWQRFGWKGKLGELYWLWRDRKGLLGNPLSCLANLLFVYGLATSIWTRVTPLLANLAVLTFGLQVIRTGVRMISTGRIYGLRFALGVPFRTVGANVLNTWATCGAISRYFRARYRKEPLRWLKTEHAYPTRMALLNHRRRLGEILVGSGYLTEAGLREGLATLQQGRRIGEHLVAIGRLTMDELYEALSLQQGLPLASLEPDDVPLLVAQSLPRNVALELKLLPFQVAQGALHLAGPELPSARMNKRIRDFTTLELRFHLITPLQFDRLATALL